MYVISHPFGRLTYSAQTICEVCEGAAGALRPAEKEAENGQAPERTPCFPGAHECCKHKCSAKYR